MLYEVITKVIVSWEDLIDREELKAEDRDSDTLYQALLSITGVEAIAIVSVITSYSIHYTKLYEMYQ